MRPNVGKPTPPPAIPPVVQARTYTVDVLGHEKSVDRLIRVLKRVDALADQELEQLKATREGRVECRVSCDHCCHRIVGVGTSEIIRIAEHLQAKLSAEERGEIVRRSNQYAEQTDPMLASRMHLARPTCPMLENGKCSIYEMRPLGCRGWNSKSAQACEAKRFSPETAPQPPLDTRQNGLAHAMSMNHSLGLIELRLQHDTLNFGSAIGDLLEHPELAGKFLQGERILMEHAMILPGPDPAIEFFKQTELNKEPSGHPPKNPIPGHPVFEFLRLSTPPVYGSQEDVTKALSRYARLTADLAELDIEIGPAFDGLKEFQTFGLPYSGENVTALLKQVGETVVYPTVARALPDLVEPRELRTQTGKLRVGYLSMNLRQQNGGHWALGWLENHAEDIETFAFNVGPWQDQVSLEFRKAAGHYYHLPGDVPSTARFIKSLELDVLIFPDIGNYGTHYQFAAMRLAPVQCTAWGQPVTSGLPTIDYYLSSEMMEPSNGEDHYTEKLVKLPGSSLFLRKGLYDSSQKSRAELGIPEGFVYLVPQNPRKLTPQWDSLYVEIQRRTGAPILFIDFNVPESLEGTKKRFAQTGVQATWLPPMSTSDFVRVQELCDVTLDPPAWHGGNTTIQGLQVGSPIVSLRGSFMRSRHSLAFLPQANVSDLIVGSAEDYVDLACDRDRIRQIMSGLNTDGLFEDRRVMTALDEFLRKAAGRG